jgi:pentapeptide repeat protein
MWLMVLAALALAVVGVTIYGYLARPGWIGVAGKKFWDYLHLLIVPTALVIGGYLLNQAQRDREIKAEQAQQQRERDAEEARRESEKAVEIQRAHDAALLAYLDKMDDMLPRLRESSNESGEGLADTRALIRARTLAILEPLDPWRKGAIMRFLSESGLLEKARPTTINLRDADFRRSDLKDLNLSNTDLQEVSFTEANLGSANLSEADLRGADLSHADLSRARLGSARLDEADLSC